MSCECMEELVLAALHVVQGAVPPTQVDAWGEWLQLGAQEAGEACTLLSVLNKEAHRVGGCVLLALVQ